MLRSGQNIENLNQLDPLLISQSQVIVQRSLASKDMIHAKAGTILAGYLKLLPMWIMVFPGMAARVLFPNTVACATPDECYATCKSKYEKTYGRKQ